MSNTTLTVGLISVPVSLKPLASSGDVRFENASPAGNPASRSAWIDKVTGEVLSGDDIRKGVFEGDEFHEIETEAIKEIEEAGKLDACEIEGFMPLEDVPFERATGAYVVTPQRGGKTPPKPLALFHEALRQTGTAAVFKLSLRTKQQPAVLYAQDGALLVNTLAWAEDCARANEAADLLASVQPEAKELKMASQLIKAMPAKRTDLDALSDDARPLKQQLLEDALAGKPVKAPKRKAAVKPEGDLAKLLQASVEASRTAHKEKVPA